MTARALATGEAVRRLRQGVRAWCLPVVLGALGLLIVAKSGLVIERVAIEGHERPASTGAAILPRAKPDPLPTFLEPEAGPAAADAPAPAAAGASGETVPEPADGQSEPREFTATELELLGMLDERRAALDEREQELDLRAAMLETAKARLAQQLEELKALQASLEARIEEHAAVEDAELGRLVKIYERMKPKAAAAIFDRLDMGVLLEVVSRMAETKASAVIARMEPARARQLTTELAAREELAHLDR